MSKKAKKKNDYLPTIIATIVLLAILTWAGAWGAFMDGWNNHPGWDDGMPAITAPAADQ